MVPKDPAAELSGDVVAHRDPVAHAIYEGLGKGVDVHHVHVAQYGVLVEILRREVPVGVELEMSRKEVRSTSVVRNESISWTRRADRSDPRARAVAFVRPRRRRLSGVERRSRLWAPSARGAREFPLGYPGVVVH